jgi:hypothetical protein
MSPVLKIFVGALMMVLGIFTSVTYSNQLINLILGGVGPLLILLGAFIVWLESDEWKMQRKQKNDPQTNSTGQQTLKQRETNEVEQETREAAQEIKQAVSNPTNSKSKAEELVNNNTVEEVKQALRERDDLESKEVLEAEKSNQNRKTLVNYLQRRIN